jgi:hypothetical protein
VVERVATRCMMVERYDDPIREGQTLR